jgi:hypothetical protein
MRERFLMSFVAAAMIGPALGWSAPAIAADARPAPRAAEVQRDHQEHAWMLAMHLARMRVELKLTPRQEKEWRPFETAVQAAAATHLDAMMRTPARSRAGDEASPSEYARMMAEHATKAAAAVEKVADASEPLFQTLTVEQKRAFGRHFRALIERLPHAAMGVHRWGHDKVDEPN